MISVASAILGVEAVEKLSFTDYLRSSSCLLKGWPRSRIVYSQGNERKSVSRPLLIGSFFHELLNGVTKLHDLPVEEGVQQIRVEYKKKVGIYKSLYPDFGDHSIDGGFDYWPEMSAILKTVIRVYRRDAESDVQPKRELELRSKSNPMFGIVDEVVETDAGIILREYKTTSNPASLLREQYIEQVHFYAILIYSVYGEFPSATYLEGLLGVTLEVELEPSRLTKICENVDSWIDRARQAVSRQDGVAGLCNVHPDNCTGCAYKLICPAIHSGDHDLSFGSTEELAVLQVLKIDVDNSVLYANVIGGTVPIGENCKVELMASTLAASEFVIGRRTIVSNLSVIDSTLKSSPASKALFCEGIGT